MNVSQIVTNEIVKRLENGVIPWQKPWSGGEAVNYITQKPYRGINRLLLDGGEYLTFKQIQDKGGRLKKGAKSHIVVFYKPVEYTNDETDEIKIVKYLRYYRVFSLDDVEGLPSKQIIKERENFTIDRCQSIVDDYINREGIKLRNLKTSSRAYYSPSTDIINVPKIEQFTSSEHYYSTLFHEMAHSSGYKLRLDRLTKTAHFGNSEYSKEELVAEITSAMLDNYTGIDSNELIDNSASYCQSWLNALKADNNMILVASAQAEKAYNYILGN